MPLMVEQNEGKEKERVKSLVSKRTRVRCCFFLWMYRNPRATTKIIHEADETVHSIDITCISL